MSKTKVIEIHSEQVLFECDAKDSAKAYEFAAEMEAMGLEVEVSSPTITESLCDSLGIIHDERDEYENSVIAEIEDHDGSCCATPNTIQVEEDPTKIH